jgi:hypothetical protein
VRYSITNVLPVGQRPENQTPSGLFDMEANVQEIVRDETDSSWYVIGGFNTCRDDELLQKCIEKRPFSVATELWAGKFTGFRLGRKPIE